MSYEREDNPDAYEASLHGEQGGVCHLVHGWIQQNIESRVIIIHYPFLAFFLIVIIRGYSYPVISLIPAPLWLQPGHTTILPSQSPKP